MSELDARAQLRWLAAQQQVAGGWPALAVVAGLATGLLIIAQAGLFALILQRALIDEAPILPLLGMLVLVVSLRLPCQWLQQHAGLHAAERVQHQVRTRLLERLAALGPARLRQHHSAGLASQLLEQVDALEGYIARYRPQRLLAFAVPACILITAFSLDWIVGLLLLLAAPLIPLFMALVGIGADQLHRDQFRTLTRLSGHFTDRIRGLITLRLFNRADTAIEEVADMADSYRVHNMRTLRIAFLSSAVLEFFAAVAIATVAIYVGFGLLGYLEFGGAADLTLFSGLFLLLLAPEFFQPLRTLAQHYHDRATAIGAAAQLRPLLEQPGPEQVPTPPTSQHAATDVALEQVAFAWPDRQALFRDLSLRVRAGECVALTGPSGSGKSTLLQLIAGFLEPDSGQVRVAGRAATAGVHCAWVSQQAFLLQGSIADNIRLGRPEADSEAVNRAAALAGVSAFTDALPAGLETRVGEQGCGLSGGQARRVTMARAWLADAPLLLLDEPTVNLDADTEALVLNALQALRDQGRTLIIASHHPAVMAFADRTLELEAAT